MCCIAVCNGGIQCKSWSLWSLRCGSGPPIQQHWQISQPCEKLWNPYQGVLTQSDPGPQKAKPPGFDPWDGEPDRAREEWRKSFTPHAKCARLGPDFIYYLNFTYIQVYIALCQFSLPLWKDFYSFLVFFAWLLASKVLLEDLWPMITIPSIRSTYSSEWTEQALISTKIH